MNRLRAGTAMEVAGVMLIPIEHSSVTARQEAGHTWLQVDKAAAAVVICEANGMRLLDVSGQPLSLEEWLPKVEGLEASVQACRSAQGPV